DGSLIGSYTDPLGSYNMFGTQLVALGDVDGDGVPDYAARGNLVDVFSGATTTPIYHITSSNLPYVYPTGFYFGASFAGLQDFDGDTFPEIVVGAPSLGTS